MKQESTLKAIVGRNLSTMLVKGYADRVKAVIKASDESSRIKRCIRDSLLEDLKKGKIDDP